MKIYTLPIEMVNALRSWFHPKDRSIILDDNTFIEGEELATPGNPVLNRGRLYWKNNFWTQLNSSGVENILGGPGLIAETTLTASAASVTFSSIPQIFRHLMLVCSIRSSAASEVDTILLRFNSDTGNNYDFQRLTGNSATASAAVIRATNAIRIGSVEGDNSRANSFSPVHAYIYQYASSSLEKYTLSQNTFFGDLSADADVFLEIRGGKWRNTTAINSVTLLPLVGPNFMSGSLFQLYGVN